MNKVVSPEQRESIAASKALVSLSSAGKRKTNQQRISPVFHYHTPISIRARRAKAAHASHRSAAAHTKRLSPATAPERSNKQCHARPIRRHRSVLSPIDQNVNSTINNNNHTSRLTAVTAARNKFNSESSKSLNVNPSHHTPSTARTHEPTDAELVALLPKCKPGTVFQMGIYDRRQGCMVKTHEFPSWSVIPKMSIFDEYKEEEKQPNKPHRSKEEREALTWKRRWMGRNCGLCGVKIVEDSPDAHAATPHHIKVNYDPKTWEKIEKYNDIIYQKSRHKVEYEELPPTLFGRGEYANQPFEQSDESDSDDDSDDNKFWTSDMCPRRQPTQAASEPPRTPPTATAPVKQTTPAITALEQAATPVEDNDEPDDEQDMCPHRQTAPHVSPMTTTATTPTFSRTYSATTTTSARSATRPSMRTNFTISPQTPRTTQSIEVSSSGRACTTATARTQARTTSAPSTAHSTATTVHFQTILPSTPPRTPNANNVVESAICELSHTRRSGGHFKCAHKCCKFSASGNRQPLSKLKRHLHIVGDHDRACHPTCPMYRKLYAERALQFIESI